MHEHGHNEPFFGMGNRGKVVNIWQWRADWQTEIETKEKLEYATKGLDLDTMIFGGEVNPVDALNPFRDCLLYTSPSPRDRTRSRMPSSA